MKKVAIWVGIGLACVVGLAILVKLAGGSGPTTDAATVNTKVKDVSATNDIILGDPKATITIYEYSDFQCPACAAFNPTINQILDNYNGQVKVVYRFFPLTNIHKNSHIAGQAGYAAWKLGKFSEMKDELFTNQADWENLSDPRDSFVEYAKSVGMDPVKFKELMNSDEAKNVVNTGEAEALAMGLNSTPSLFIDKKQFAPSDFNTVKSLIDNELKSPSSDKPLASPTTAPLQ